VRDGINEAATPRRLGGGPEMMWLTDDNSEGSFDLSSSSGFDIEGYFLSSRFFLALSYLVLASVSFTRFVLIFVYKHNPKSLETSFYCLGGIWGLLRTVFFLSTPFFVKVNPFVHVVYGLPANFQVAIYSLLLLYCAQRVHYAKWDKIHKKLYWVFIIMNTILLITNIVALTLVLSFDVSSTVMTHVNSAVFLLCYVLIGVAFIGYCLALILQKKRHALFKHENQRALIALTATIAVCMTVHCIWDVINLISEKFIAINSKIVKDQVAMFFMFLFWELIPAFAVIGFFGRIPTGSQSFQEQPVTVTVVGEDGSDKSLGPSGMQDAEERQGLLAPSSRRSFDSTSPGSLNNSLRHGSTIIPNAAMRGTAPLVSNDGSTPNFGFVNKQLADLAAGEAIGGRPYVPPGRSSLEFNSTEESDAKQL